MKLKKDKMYSIRLNEALVLKIKEEEGLSPQQIIDEAYESYLASEDDMEDL